MIVSAAARQSAAHVAAQTHRSGGVEAPQGLVSEWEGIEPLPTTRGAEQGDVDGFLECSLALVMVAAEARLSTAEQQFQVRLPWTGAGSAEHIQRIRSDLFAKTERL